MAQAFGNIDTSFDRHSNGTTPNISNPIDSHTCWHRFGPGRRI